MDINWLSTAGNVKERRGNRSRWQEKGWKEQPPSFTSGDAPRSREALLPDPAHPIPASPTQERSERHRGFLHKGMLQRDDSWDDPGKPVTLF